MTLVGLVADDLTGATDSAVQFAAQGWRAVLALRPQTLGADAAVGTTSLVAVTTDSRAAGDAATERTTTAVGQLLAAGADRLYLKVDSTMRGSVAAQVAGAVAAWDAAHPGCFAVVCPAYPAMGRTVEDGLALVAGEPLEAGPAGRDPVTPVTTSRMVELVPGAVHVPRPSRTDPVVLAAELADAAQQARVLVVDAADDSDLRLLAAAVAALGPRAVPAGSAGLATAMASAWLPAEGPGAARDAETRDSTGRARVVVLVTSLHRVAREQEQHLRQERSAEVTHLAPALADLSDDARCAAWLDGARRAVAGDDRDVVLVTAPEERAGPDGPTASEVARRLADVVAALVDDVEPVGVVVTGGDGARALVDRWDATGLAVLDAVAEGTPAGRLVGGQQDDLPVVTKAGGFGASDALVGAVAYLARRHAAGSRTGSTSSARDGRTA